MATFFNPFCILLIAYTVTGRQVERKDLPRCEDIKDTWYGAYLHCMPSEKCYKDPKEAMLEKCPQERKMVEEPIIKSTTCSSLTSFTYKGHLALCTPLMLMDSFKPVYTTNNYREGDSCSDKNINYYKTDDEVENINYRQKNSKGECDIQQSRWRYKKPKKRVSPKKVPDQRVYDAKIKCSLKGKILSAIGFINNGLDLYFVTLCVQAPKGYFTPDSYDSAHQEMQNRVNDMRELEQELVEMDILRMIFAKQRRDRQERYYQRYDFD